MAGLPVSGWARICGRLAHHRRDLAQQRDLVAELALAVGQLANRLAELVDAVTQALLRPGELDRPGACSFGGQSAGRACSATRVSSRRFTSPSRICSASSTRAGGRLLFDLALHVPLPAGSTRSSAQRSSVSDQYSHWAIDRPFSFFTSSPSCRRLPTTSSCRISSSTVLNR